MLADQTGGYRATQIAHIRDGSGIVVVQCVPDAKHETFDQRVALTEPWKDFQTGRITDQNVSRYLSYEGAAQIQMKGADDFLHPDAEVHSTGYHDHAAAWDE